MKKIFGFMMLLPLLLTACSEDDNDFDFPDVKFDVHISGAKIVDGKIYVVRGDVLNIEGIEVAPVDANERVMIGSVSYYWDGMFIGTNGLEPYSCSIDTKNTKPGKHLLQMKCSLFAVNYPIVNGYLSYPVKVVENEDDIPDGVVATKFTIIPTIDD